MVESHENLSSLRTLYPLIMSCALKANPLIFKKVNLMN